VQPLILSLPLLSNAIPTRLTLCTGILVEYGEIAPILKDAVANKDERYSVSLNCQYDDNGEKAGNEWKGAWLHSILVEIEGKWEWVEYGERFYAFKMSRPLNTPSDGTNAQL
jgi:hypothetical protein